MGYRFTPPPPANGDWTPTWGQVTLSLPADTPLGLPPGGWERDDGRVLATFTREELVASLRFALELKLAGLEERLERGLQLLDEAEEDDVGRLRAHWDTLNAEYNRTAKAWRFLTKG